MSNIKHLTELPPLYFIRLTDQENMFLHYEEYQGRPSFIAKEGIKGAPAWTHEKGLKMLIYLGMSNLELVPCADVINAQLPPAKELPYA